MAEKELTINGEGRILSYPQDVTLDGHYVLLTIFETEGVNYKS